jgi:predicted acetyltransferase
VGLATVPEYRRRGFCLEVIDAILAEHFEGGGEIAWLTPIDEHAGRVYERAGFYPIGTQVIYAMPE